MPPKNNNGLISLIASEDGRQAQPDQPIHGKFVRYVDSLRKMDVDAQDALRLMLRYIAAAEPVDIAIRPQTVEAPNHLYIEREFFEVKYSLMRRKQGIQGIMWREPWLDFAFQAELRGFSDRPKPAYHARTLITLPVRRGRPVEALDGTNDRWALNLRRAGLAPLAGLAAAKAILAAADARHLALPVLKKRRSYFFGGSSPK